MKTLARILLLAALVLCAGRPAAADDTVDEAIGEPSAAFAEASAAYDAGLYEEAARGYRALFEAGYADPAVLFNLGNAFLRAGDVGEAVAAYRRAWYAAPRDGDIRANLNFAREATGAVIPPVPLPARLLQLLSVDEWALAAAALWWTLAGLILFALLRERGRRTALKAAAVPAILLAISLAGVAHWLRLTGGRELVVLDTGVHALYAPLEDAETYFETPAGSILRLAEVADSWYRVRLGDREGWIRAAACRPLRAHPVSMEE